LRATGRIFGISQITVFQQLKKARAAVNFKTTLAPTEQTFRAVYFLRLILGNILGLTVGAFLAAAATNLGLRLVGKPTYLRGAVGGAILGAVVGAVTAGSCPFVLLISSKNTQWAWIMIERSFLVGGVMGLTNGLFAGLVIVFFIKRQTVR